MRGCHCGRGRLCTVMQYREGCSGVEVTCSALSEVSVVRYPKRDSCALRRRLTWHRRPAILHAKCISNVPTALHKCCDLRAIIWQQFVCNAGDPVHPVVMAAGGVPPSTIDDVGGDALVDRQVHAVDVRRSLRAQEQHRLQQVTLQQELSACGQHTHAMQCRRQIPNVTTSMPFALPAPCPRHRLRPEDLKSHEPHSTHWTCSHNLLMPSANAYVGNNSGWQHLHGHGARRRQNGHVHLWRQVRPVLQHVANEALCIGIGQLKTAR